MSEPVYLIQAFVVSDGRELPNGRPRVFYGKNAEKVSNDYLETFCFENNYLEMEKGDFNERLFKSRCGENDYCVELVKLESEHYIHNCA